MRQSPPDDRQRCAWWDLGHLIRRRLRRDRHGDRRTRPAPPIPGTRPAGRATVHSPTPPRPGWNAPTILLPHVAAYAPRHLRTAGAVR